MLAARASARPTPMVAARPARPAVRRVAARAPLHVVAAKGGEEGGKVFDRSVYGIVASNANFSMLGSALTSAGFEGQLTGTGPFTVFAPNDDVFGDALKSLGTTKLELLNLPALPDILKNHVIAGAVTSADMKEGAELTTLGGGKLKVTAGPCINGFALVKKDIKATNGILHSIKGVLAP